MISMLTRISKFPNKASALVVLGVALGAASPQSGEAKSKTKSTYGSSISLARSAGKHAKVDFSAASQRLKRGLAAVSKGDMKTALTARNALTAGGLEQKILSWVIALSGRDVNAQTLSILSQELADWPAAGIIRKNVERALVRETSGEALRVAFSASQPETVSASIALAKAYLSVGAQKAARSTIAAIWRNNVLAAQERGIIRTFGRVLTRADHRDRIEYLLSRQRIRSAQRIAGLAGATRLVAARAAVERKQRDAGNRLKAVPRSQRNQANYILSKARHLRRRGELGQAASALLAVSPKEIPQVTRDGFWTEQRILASDLLEEGRIKTAYQLAAHNTAKSAAKRIDAEFYAGWLALRKLGDGRTAIRHFERLLNLASTPLSISRGRYWLGRAQMKAGNKAAANKSFAAAARHDTTYYGQLAARRLGRKAIDVSRPAPTGRERAQFTRYELVQVIAKLESANQHRHARMIYHHLARQMERAGELALLAARAERKGDYQLALQIGKQAFNRGMSVDTLAYPVGAIARSTRTSGAGLAIAYAIARQESTFQVDARSSANALGLLQLVPKTAKSIARKIGVSYSRKRLVSDGSYNARLGTAYFKQQLNRFGGSYIVTFAAYNAGPRRAEDWIKRFGDPRGKSLDFTIDWVEQIPFAETRNYIQRLMENYQVYNSRLNGARLTIGRDLAAGSAS